jgi:hypothetical protein
MLMGLTSKAACPFACVRCCLMAVALGMALLAGCRAPGAGGNAAAVNSGNPPFAGLSAGQMVYAVSATCVPPVGWKADPLKSSGSHAHQVWLSPTGDTAYGVIHFALPLPVGDDLSLIGFLSEMRKSEGEAILLSKKRDPNLPGLRFVAEGGIYKVRANLITHGFEGWAIYAGTLRNHTERPEELDLAERARDNTVVGQR